jgi:GNAT superfamily N-acetyltransferase
LLDVLVERARASGCRTVRCNFTDGPAAAFSASVGAVEGIASIRNLLTLPHRDTAVPVPGYALRSWLDRTPDDLLEDMARAWDAINDAPTTEGIEPDQYTPERVREIEESVRLRRVQSRWTVALDVAGRIVGFTEVRVGPEPGALATTEDTAVVAEHRGRGLASWIKAESLRQLHQDRPDVTQVVTANAETNAAMLAVNARLGFRAVSRWRQALLNIAR